MMLSHTAVGSLPPFDRSEYMQRVAVARELMDAAFLDALLITGEANFRYFTGFNSQSWVNPTRPMFFILPRTAEPVAIIPAGSRVAMQRTAWITNVQTWPAPRPADDGVSLVVEALRAAVGPKGRIGGEFGPEQQLRMPLIDFWRVQAALAPVEFVDGSGTTRRVRMRKSAAEIARIRAIAGIVSDGFEHLPSVLRTGATEQDACLALQLAILRAGGERCPYMIAASGPDGYETINTNPADRALRWGDVLIIDTGSTVDGYFCDFDRNFAFGRPSDEARSAHRLVYEATEAGIAALRPGVTASDVWHAMAKHLGKEGVEEADVGRMGHGLGLQLTEPPSIHPEDRTVLEAGMVITIEPGIAYRTAAGSRRVMVHEENLVITDSGVELLTRRAPADMPVIA